MTKKKKKGIYKDVLYSAFLMLKCELKVCNVEITFQV